MTQARITRDPIDPATLLARVGADAHGATSLFLGHVRDHNDGRPVDGLRYEAYHEMAGRVLAEIAEEAVARLEAADADGGRVAVVHRIGELEIGEVSVAIAVSSAHRAEAYEASRYVIEEIKRRLPVWKRERYVDGGEAWVEGCVPAEAPPEARTAVVEGGDE